MSKMDSIIWNLNSILLNWAGGMAQEIEHLPSKCDALCLNPTTTKTNKQKQKKINILLNKPLSKKKKNHQEN
jgi:hypothetical protein